MVVYCTEGLSDPKNGDFDTIGVWYVLKPDGEKDTIERFFKEAPDGWEEITKQEYFDRVSDSTMLNTNVGNEWIPVTERLPEVVDTYLVVVKYKYDYEKEYSRQFKKTIRAHARIRARLGPKFSTIPFRKEAFSCRRAIG